MGETVRWATLCCGFNSIFLKILKISQDISLIYIFWLSRFDICVWPFYNSNDNEGIFYSFLVDSHERFVK